MGHGYHRANRDVVVRATAGAGAFGRCPGHSPSGTGLSPAAGGLHGTACAAVLPQGARAQRPDCGGRAARGGGAQGGGPNRSGARGSTQADSVLRGQRQMERRGGDGRGTSSCGRDAGRSGRGSGVRSERLSQERDTLVRGGEGLVRSVGQGGELPDRAVHGLCDQPRTGPVGSSAGFAERGGGGAGGSGRMARDGGGKGSGTVGGGGG